MKKSEKLQNAIGMIGEDLIYEAKEKTKNVKSIKWTAVIAACLTACIISGAIFIPGWNAVSPKSFALATANYPDMPDHPGNGSNEKKYDEWASYRREKRKAFNALDIDLNDFFGATIAEFLSGSNEKNVVYSPLNVYMALAMTAEMTDGESRAQILALLGENDIETLRHEANTVWNATYVDDGSKKALLASSLWLSDNIGFNQSTLDIIAENYYASAFRGTMGSKEYTTAYKNWKNEQTDNLLEDSVNNLELSAETILALATTVNFFARWDIEFREKNNKELVFHGTSGDKETEFMYASYDSSYFWGEKFSAVAQSFTDGGTMYFILPDEGISPEELLENEEAMQFIIGANRKNNQYLKVNRSIPKFDVASELDLIGGLQNLGVTDIFSFEASDFTPLTNDTDVAISKATHGARVMIDEEGCKAVAFTALEYAGSPPPPDEIVDFVLDRPFIFVITSQTDLPLFVGIINNIAS
jgi:serpin B